MLKRIQVLEDGGVAAKEARSWRIEGPKRRITRKEYQSFLNKFEMEGCVAQKDWAISLERGCCRTGESYQRKRVTSSENTSLQKEENETGSVRRRCVGSVSVKALDFFSQRVRSGELWWSFLGGPFGEA